VDFFFELSWPFIFPPELSWPFIFNFSHRYKMKMLDSLSCSTAYGELIPQKSSKKSKGKALKMHY
jgi:hypothetical protein